VNNGLFVPQQSGSDEAASDGNGGIPVTITYHLTSANKVWKQKNQKPET